MLFNSFHFFLFFPFVTTLYYLLPHRYRWTMLLTASCYFYMTLIPAYIFILLVLILIDYQCGLWIENAPPHRKKLYLVLSIASTCLALFIFKYFNFFNHMASHLSKMLHIPYAVPTLQLLLPLGLSFHTFQSLSYVIEVYRGHQKAERHLGIYSLYVMFYPQLVAGPIERPGNLLHQFRELHIFDSVQVTHGLQLMLWGLFKKVVVADRLAVIVDTIYNQPVHFSGPALTLATLFFAFQIYYDFSGYSDIALGAAQVMGFKLTKNFNRPYAAGSITDFWRRWHISLSTWFRDYLYIPLGGNRVGLPRWTANIFITFLISGLWHGANWTFAVWGALHGTYLIAERWLKSWRIFLSNMTRLNRLPRLQKSLSILATFLLTCFAWIFFRAASLHYALSIVRHLGANWGTLLSTEGRTAFFETVQISPSYLFVLAGLILLVEFIQMKDASMDFRIRLTKIPVLLRWSLYYLAFFSILFTMLSGVYGGHRFIYFQF